MSTVVTERTFGTRGMGWSDLLGTFGYTASVGKRPSELHWERPVPRPAPPAERASPVKPCAACGEPFERRPGEPPSLFAARRTCSKSCASRLGARTKAKTVELRPCRHCGAPMPRRGSPADYARRRYCDRACERAHRAAAKLPPEEVRRRKREQMRARRGGLTRGPYRAKGAA